MTADVAEQEEGGGPRRRAARSGLSTDPVLLAPPDGGDPRRAARNLFFQGWRLTEIADWLELPLPTVASWKGRDKWESALPLDRVECVIEAKLVQLVCLPSPMPGWALKEIDHLTRQLERTSRVRRYGQPGGHEGDLNPAVSERGRKARAARPAANLFTDEQACKLIDLFHEENFAYQENWWASSSLRTRCLLKSRQVGASWYFAREALITALETGRNQIFLSASKNQARVFREYVVAFAAKVGVELKGDPISLPPNEAGESATLYFLATNSRTAQGYHGDFIFDEFFWTQRFRTLNKVARAMATQKMYRKTYLSTPSSIQHEAYDFWSGAEFNRNRPKDQRAAFNLTHEHLRGGRMGPDGMHREILTIHDAVARGMDRFDVEELQRENNPADFSNLYLCEFVDDTQSVFPLSMLSPCMVDAWESWADVDWLAMSVEGRPYTGPVWIGYDPTRSGDRAALIVLAAPPAPGLGKFRVLEKHRFAGMDFPAQAEAIRRICTRYRVEKIAVDHNGLGVAVLDLVRVFFPGVATVDYTPEGKQRMVLKLWDVIKGGRLEFDAGDTDLAAALMAIRKAITASGRSITYEAGRSDEGGHADLAWALMNAVVQEPIDAAHGGARRGLVEVY